MTQLRRVLALVAVVALLVSGWSFAAANGTPVMVSWVVGNVEAVPLWKALLAAFLLGGALATVVCLFQVARLGLLARRLRKAVGQLEAEVHELRTLPLAGDGERKPPAEASSERAGLPSPGAAGRGV